MEITLNDQIHTIAESTMLSEIVLSQLGEKQNGVAVALNNSVIPKSLWQTTLLKSNDNILIIKATQGG
jgi:sulfur carrier protein